MINLEVDGVPFSNFISIGVSRSMETFAGTFQFVATDSDAQAFPIRVGSECKVALNNEPLITGYVEAISPSVDARSHEIVIQGRDITADLVDSTLASSSVELIPPLPIEDIIQKTLDAIGLDLKIINEVPNLAPFNKEDLVSAKAGDGAFNFLEKFARKRQVLLTTNGDGAIVITRNSETPIEGGFELINRKDGNGNNILRSNSKVDNTKRFNKYIVVSQSNGVSLNNFGKPNLKQAVGTKNQAVIDEDIRPGRVLHIVAEKASTPAQDLERAKWEANIRKARSRTYSATVDGITIPGTEIPFPINRLVKIDDADASTSAIMLIKSVDYKVTKDGGAETKFNIVDRNAYTLTIAEPKNQKRTNPVAAVFDKSRFEEA